MGRPYRVNIPAQNVQKDQLKIDCLPVENERQNDDDRVDAVKHLPVTVALISESGLITTYIG